MFDDSFECSLLGELTVQLEDQGSPETDRMDTGFGHLLSADRL